MKKKIELTEEEARSLYKTADSTWKKVLENTFGLSFFSEKLIDRIKTIDDVYKELGRIKPIIKDYYHLPEFKRERALNTQYIDDISELFNEGWIADWTNHTQYKYYVWFERKALGWVFDISDCLSYCSFVGSGFYYKSKEVSDYCGKQFLDIYKIVLG